MMIILMNSNGAILDEVHYSDAWDISSGISIEIQDLESNNNLEESIFKMKSLLNEYFHFDGSIPLFNGANNNYTKTLWKTL